MVSISFHRRIRAKILLASSGFDCLVIQISTHQIIMYLQIAILDYHDVLRSYFDAFYSSEYDLS